MESAPYPFKHNTNIKSSDIYLMTKINTPSFFSLIHDGNCFTKKTDKSQLSRNIYSNNAKIACLFHLICENDKK